MNRLALLISVISLPLPGFVRRWLLRVFCRYELDADARIGASLIGCSQLRMGPGARIGHFNVIKGVTVVLEESATIGDFNWISGLPPGTRKHFHGETDRDPRLHMGRHAALTARHYLDCCNRITIGAFSTVAGARSQILTHAIDIRLNRQVSGPVDIGRYCFIGTNVVLLKGSRLPDYSVLAAKSSLARAFDETHTLYSGVPAEAVRPLDRDAAYFHRTRGSVE